MYLAHTYDMQHAIQCNINGDPIILKVPYVINGEGGIWYSFVSWGEMCRYGISEPEEYPHQVWVVLR